MGCALSKAVESVIVDRHGGPSFRIGVAEMNGFRQNMEDAHVVHTEADWGFFGVFDGHGGSECSEFISARLHEELANGRPADDAAVTSLMLRLDKEFLDTSKKSGSTGTFVIVELDTANTGKHCLRVGNIGDSRVLLGRLSTEDVPGAIVPGPGTDSGLTTDHKPDHPSERERIIRSGNAVQQQTNNVARVNGELAVSRSFGDSKYKMDEKLPPQEQAVSAEPELCTVSCGKTDFLMLVCDGISEGEFPNAEVVALAASQLREHGDPGKAAVAVCRKALQQNSKDNLTCMIVLLTGGDLGPCREFLPGPFSAPEDDNFRNAYDAVAKVAGFTLAQAVEMRYDMVQRNKELNETDLSTDMSEERREESLKEKAELDKELKEYKDGPPRHLASGSKERTDWFEECIKQMQQNTTVPPAGIQAQDLLSLLMNTQQRAQQVRPPVAIRTVRVPSEGRLKEAVDQHPSLKWSDGQAQWCGQKVDVVEDDEKDDTSKVVFCRGQAEQMTCWLPTAVLEEVAENE